MPDQTVKVTLNATTNPPTITLDHDTITMTASGLVIWTQGPTIPVNTAWSFTGVVQCDGTALPNPPFDAPTILGAGKTMQVRDTFASNGKKATFNYKLQYTVGTTSYTSTDPQIVNDPSPQVP